MIKRRKTKHGSTIFTHYDDESVGTTEFRRLVRNLQRQSNPSEIRSVLVTSAMKGEGKSLIAANLAIAIAKREVDKEILLLDCDLRRPEIYRLFGIEREPGLVFLLTREVEPIEVARDTELRNLKVIPSGPTVDSPSQLLANARDVLDKCEEQFDMVICDAPPVVPVDDVGLIGPYVDGVLMVVLAGKTDRLIVKRAIDILKDQRVTILGITLNNLYGTLPYYYDYKYYRYKYEREETSEEHTALLQRGGEEIVPRYRWSRVHRFQYRD